MSPSRRRRTLRLFATLILAGSLSHALAAAPKYVFLFIGDGMGSNQVASAARYLAASGAQLAMETLPVRGWSMTADVRGKTTDSAASGTAMACGVKTQNGKIGVDADGTPVTSVAVAVHEAGRQVGLLSSVSIDHATPAAFYAHDPSRKNYLAIAKQLPASGFEFIGAGALKSVDVHSGKDDDSVALRAELATAGYTFAAGGADCAALTAADLPVFASHAGKDAMPNVIDGIPAAERLSAYVSKAIELLSAGDKPFFMMVEGGRIDWNGHSNDGAALLAEVLDLDASVALALAFQKRRPDETLIVVTADHETGDLSLAPVPAKDVAAAFDAVKDGGERPGKKELNVALGMAFGSGGHTGVNVPVYAGGVGAEAFDGTYPNTGIHSKLLGLMLEK